ncbi:hypothetical protein HZS_4429 [Henneguya salminicola]|nr:hypothetical protein HZS_4429 [Henneguya salminicola]
MLQNKVETNSTNEYFDSHYSIYSLAQEVLSCRDKTVKFCVDFGLIPNAKFCSSCKKKDEIYYNEKLQRYFKRMEMHYPKMQKI